MLSNLLSILLFAEKVNSKFDSQFNIKFNSKFSTGDTLRRARPSRAPSAGPGARLPLPPPTAGEPKRARRHRRAPARLPLTACADLPFGRGRAAATVLS